MIEWANFFNGLIALLMLIYLVWDRQVKERRRQITFEKEEVKRHLQANQRYETLQKRVHRIEIGMIGLLDAMLGDKNPSDIRKEILDLLYKNPSWKTGEDLERILFRYGWEGYSRCRNYK